MLLPTDLAPSRPPCSLAEREAADEVQARIRKHGLRPVIERVRAPTSPTWAPLIRSLLRLWGAAFLAAGWPMITAGLAGAAILGGLPPVAGALRFIPLLGAPSRNVVAVKRGTTKGARPIVVCAHLDTHGTAGAPMHRAHVLIAAASAWLALFAGLIARPGVGGWRPAAALVAAEAVFTLVWLARRELSISDEPPDDNTSGLLSLVRLAEIVGTSAPTSDLWIVATAGGTSGGYGIRSFLKAHAPLREGWIIEIDALGAGEVVVTPFPSRFPQPGTPAMLLRTVVAAARESGDPLTVRRLRRGHSDAAAALSMRVGAITLTGGLRPPAGGYGPDPANAERAARIADCVARLAT